MLGPWALVTRTGIARWALHCLVLNLTLASACTEPTQSADSNLPPDGDYPLTLVTRATVYVPGETVKLFLRNDGPEHLGFAFCGEPLERRVKGGWAEIQNDLGPCPGFLPSIDPGIAVIVSYGLRTDHLPGEYRVRPWFSTTSKGRFFRRSNTFTIR